MQWMMVCTQVDGSVWVTLLALIWLYGCKIEQQVEWQFVAMKAASWIGSQKGEISIPDHLDSVSVHQETFELISSVLWHTLMIWVCVCVCFSGRSEGNVRLGCQVTKETLGIWRRQCFYILIREKTKEQKLINLLWFCYLFNVKWSHALCQKFLWLCFSVLPLLLCSLSFPPPLGCIFFCQITLRMCPPSKPTPPPGKKVQAQD